MLRVRDLVLELRIKWFRQLWSDKGASWSTFVWPQVLTALPSALMPGMSFVSDAWIQNIDPFYQDAIWSYVNLNCLARAMPLDNPLPQNVWACHENKTINYPLVHAGIIEVSDLLLQNGSVDHSVLQRLSAQQGSKQSVFLLFVSLQQKFKSYFHLPHLDGELPLEIFKKVKKII